MRFVGIHSSDAAGQIIASHIAESLANGPVVWLLSGGSAIAPQVAAAQLLTQQSLALDRLTVTLIDERYGEPGHANSNWTQLESAGFKIPGAQMLPVLVANQPPAAVAQRWWSRLEPVLQNGTSIGVLGIGPDYHIAGIKPDSPATRSTESVCAYEWSDYSRITLTASALQQLDHIWLYAMGPSKWPVIEHLETSNNSLTSEPGQLLKQWSQATILTDRPEAIA